SPAPPSFQGPPASPRGFLKFPRHLPPLRIARPQQLLRELPEVLFRAHLLGDILHDSPPALRLSIVSRDGRGAGEVGPHSSVGHAKGRSELEGPTFVDRSVPHLTHPLPVFQEQTLPAAFFLPLV